MMFAIHLLGLLPVQQRRFLARLANVRCTSSGGEGADIAGRQVCATSRHASIIFPSPGVLRRHGRGR